MATKAKTSKKSTKQVKAKTSVKPTLAVLKIIRTVYASDGARIEFAPTPLWLAFEAYAIALSANGVNVPLNVVSWHSRYSTMYRINGGMWFVADTDAPTICEKSTKATTYLN